MPKFYSILICLLFAGLGAHAQPYETNPDYKRANIWHFGYGAGLDFNSGTPVPISGGQTGHTSEGFSTICDTAGNLLIYTNGQTIWNKNHSVVESGTGLMGNFSSTQASLLLQHSENDSLIYLFTTPSATNSATGLRYNVINSKLNNGAGRVILKNKLLLSPTTEKLTAINHANGKDIWVIAHGYTSNSYFSYLLTKDGLIECPVQSVTGNILEEIPALWFLNTQGNLISNYQGNQIASAILHTGKVEIFDFNNQKGTLKITDTILFSSNVYSVAYNRKDNRLFIQTVDTNRDTSYFYHYENKELVLIAKYLHGTIQYMVNFNDIIYVGNMDSTFVSSIENLNDSLPIFKAKAVDLSPSITSIGLCNFNPSYHYTPPINFTVKLNCVTNTIQFNGQDTFQANTHSWEISKQGITMTASIKNPLIEFDDTGTYQVRYIASNGSRSDTITKTVDILPKIDKYFLGSDTGWCENSNGSVTLKAPSDIYCYEWNTGATSDEISADTAGIYIAKITTPNFCVLYDTITITIDTLPNVAPDFLGDNLHWCENLDTSVTLKAPDGFHSYLWNTNETTQEIEASNEGMYWIRAATANGCATADTLVISLDTLPDMATGFLGDNISWCENLDTSVILAAPADMQQYLWNTNDTIQQIEAGAGTYWVAITAHNLCVFSDTVTVSIDTLPDIAPDFLGGNLNWCENLDTSVILKAPADMHQYFWNTNETTQEIEVSNEGVYWVRATAYNNCILYDTLTVSFDTVPNVPEIYRDNDTLKTNTTADIYRWYLNEQEVGNNEPRLVLTDTGVYRLMITNAFGCSAFSDTIHVPDTANISVSTILFIKNIKLYPNPATTELTIEVLEQGGYSYEITGIAGNLITSGSLQRGGNTIDISRTSAGIYLVHVLIDNNRITTYKLIKQTE